MSRLNLDTARDEIFSYPAARSRANYNILVGVGERRSGKREPELADEAKGESPRARQQMRGEEGVWGASEEGYVSDKKAIYSRLFWCAFRWQNERRGKYARHRHAENSKACSPSLWSRRRLKGGEGGRRQGVL